MDSFNIRLKRIREERNLSIKEIASRVGVPVSTYREWEYGRAIKGEPYVKIAEALGVGVYELLTGEVPNMSQAYEKIHMIERACAELRKEFGSFV
jgi:transcriptional regulator with XRE-family HTH domain